MKNRIKEVLKFLIPLLAIYVMNYFVSTNGEFMQGHIAVKMIIITIVYCAVCFIVNTKNKYLNIDNLHKFRYLLCAIVFVILVGLKFHGSSIFVWDNYYRDYGTTQAKTVYYGVPRAVRSDEWLVQTPLYLSQETGDGKLSRINENIRSDGQDIIVSAYAPAWDLSTIGKPFNWGFLFLGNERGLSWYWSLKLITLIITSYEMAYILSKKNKVIGLIGSMMIAFAPGSQWWFSSMVDLIILAQGIVVAVYYYINSSKRYLKILNTLTFIVCGIGFVISLYPPIQVSFGYFILILLLYFVFTNKEKIKKADIFNFILSVLVIFAVVGYFIYTGREALSLLSGTVYPGAREELGGNGSLVNIGNYLFGWFLPFKETSFSNNSELSGYISLLPTVIILFFMRDRKNKDNKLVIAVFVYMMILCSFIVIKYPAILAKIILFTYLTQERILITLGIVSTYFLCMLLPDVIENKKKLWISALITVVSLIVLYVPMLNTGGAEYLGNMGMAVSVMLFAVLIYYFVRGHVKEITPFVVVFMCITGALVNPICRGLAPIYAKEVSKAVTKINNEDPGKWVAIDNLVGGDFLNANGVKVFNSTHHYPDLKMWRSLDENGEYENIYNRFEHIIVNIVDEKTSFELVQDDVITVNINIDDLYKTGIKYLVINKSLDEFNKDGKEKFKEMYYNVVDNVYIYKYIA